METIGSYYAKTHLPALIARAGKGEKILITHRGKPAAMLVPVGEQGEDTTQQVEAFLRYVSSNRYSLAGLSIKALIEEGRP